MFAVISTSRLGSLNTALPDGVVSGEVSCGPGRTVVTCLTMTSRQILKSCVVLHSSPHRVCCGMFNDAGYGMINSNWTETSSILINISTCKMFIDLRFENISLNSSEFFSAK